MPHLSSQRPEKKKHTLVPRGHLLGNKAATKGEHRHLDTKRVQRAQRFLNPFSHKRVELTHRTRSMQESPTAFADVWRHFWLRARLPVSDENASTSFSRRKRRYSRLRTSSPHRMEADKRRELQRTEPDAPSQRPETRRRNAYRHYRDLATLLLTPQP